MKNILFLLGITLISLETFAQTICDPGANVVLFSNYDGGVLNINCDVNIPNLKIGVVSYEMVTINLTGPFVNNITEVRFAGYTTTTHQHCSNTPPVTSITGAPAGTDTLIFMPPSPLSNPNGYGIIICNTSCDTTSNQGGCNTADQVAAYFIQEFGGALRFHYTQYNCWTGTYDLSAGGNCCVGAVPPSGAPFSAFQSSDTSFCEKTCIDFADLSTNNPTNWQWYFPGADTTSSNLQSPTNICYSSYGSFDVTLIACNTNGCDTLIIPNFIHEYQNPVVPVITSNADTLFSTPSYSYQWCDSAGAIAGANGPYYVYQQPGFYYVIVTDSNGCATSSTVIGTGINEHHSATGEFRVVPNPSDGRFEVYGPAMISKHATCEVTDITGRLVFSSRLENLNQKLDIDLGDVMSGVYFIRIITGHEMINKRIVINRMER